MIPNFCKTRSTDVQTRDPDAIFLARSFNLIIQVCFWREAITFRSLADNQGLTGELDGVFFYIKVPFYKMISERTSAARPAGTMMSLVSWAQLKESHNPVT